MIIEKSEIAKELKKLKSLTPAKKSDEVNGVLFKNNMLMANNLEITATAKLDVDTDEQFVIPMKAIELIENLPAGEIKITEKGSRLYIESKSGKSSFSTFKVDEFPQFDIVDLTERQATFGYDSEAIAEAINKVLYACGNNSPRPVMNGILLKGDGKYLNIVACDGYRLAWNQINYAGQINAVIPRSTIQKVLSLGLQGNIELYTIDNKKAAFKTDKYTVYTRLLEGQYISYEKMFEEEGYDTKASVKRVELLESVARSLVCTSSNMVSKTILESTEGGNLAITLKDTIADFREEVEVYGDIENPIKIGFNPRFLIDCLKASDEDNIDIYYKNSEKALILLDGAVKQLVLPVRM